MSDTVAIVGAGQAGLAMSRCLTDLSIDHVVLERATTANSWKSERWDSLSLLTPNWMSRLPNYGYSGDDPDGYMGATQVAEYLEGYRRSFDAPIIEDTTVRSVASTYNGFEITTSSGPRTARAVVVATGASRDPFVPTIGSALPTGIRQISPNKYRNPYQLDRGGILIVGASASGIQIAEELSRAGRHVVLSVGSHIRVPRSYRGMDIYWWMSSLGSLDERYDEVDDIERVRSLPSLQLVGSPDQRDINLNTMDGFGVELVGRLAGIQDGNLQFSGGLANEIAMADLKQNRLLTSIDEYVEKTGLTAELPDPHRPEATRVPRARTSIGTNEFKTVIWATGYRPRYPWLEPQLLQPNGAIHHNGGVMAQPGMYALGLRFMRRRKSNFIDGVGDDARDLSSHLVKYLDKVTTRS